MRSTELANRTEDSIPRFLNPFQPAYWLLRTALCIGQCELALRSLMTAIAAHLVVQHGSHEFTWLQTNAPKISETGRFWMSRAPPGPDSSSVADCLPRCSTLWRPYAEICLPRENRSQTRCQSTNDHRSCSACYDCQLAQKRWRHPQGPLRGRVAARRCSYRSLNRHPVSAPSC